MRKFILLFIAIFATMFTAKAQAPVKDVSGNITGNVYWSFDTIYLLKGKVYLKSGATLTIAPGTIVKGDYSTPGSALIVTRGAKIYAVGEVNRPIVFTSSQTPGNRMTGDWGGVVIAGNAKVNVPGGEAPFEGGNLSNPDGTVSDGNYGGLNDLDNSGELKYVRIEYAGFPYALNNELNSLTLGGVGSGTKLSYIQCSYGYDDAFEWFGGTVNASHLISYRTNDDDFDTDFGYSGRVQFGVVLRDTAVADAVSGANGFESDNDASGTGQKPYTAPVFSNITLVGPQFTPTTQINTNHKRGAHIRRNSRLSLFNSIVMGYPVGIKVDGDSCHRNADSLWLQIQNTVLAGCTQQLDSTGGNVWDITPWFYTAGNSNNIYPNNSDVQLTNPFDYVNPDFRPMATSPMLTGASFSNTKLSATYFDQSPTYRGAFGNVNWMEGWASFTCDTNSYLNGLGPVSVKNIQSIMESIDVYPNPTQGLTSIAMNVKENADVKCQITDLSGHTIFSSIFKATVGRNEFTFNTNNLSNGMYLIHLNANGSTNSLKLSVMK